MLEKLIVDKEKKVIKGLTLIVMKAESIWVNPTSVFLDTETTGL